MAVTATATLLGTYCSKLSVIALSSNTGSTDILTVAHLLGTTPDTVDPLVRSVTTIASGGVPGLAVVSFNGSQAVIFAPSSGGAQNIIVDVFCEYVQSTNR